MVFQVPDIETLCPTTPKYVIELAGINKFKDTLTPERAREPPRFVEMKGDME
jgi:hypothetical protein